MEQVKLEKYMNQLVEVYSNDLNSDEETFALGYLIQVESEFCVFESIDTNGLLESIQLRKNQSINRIEAETNYVKLYQRFVAYNQAEGLYDLYHLLQDFKKEQELEAYFKDENQIYSFIRKNDEAIIKGYVEEIINSEKLRVKTIDLETFTLGESLTLKLNDLILAELFSTENFLLNETFGVR